MKFITQLDMFRDTQTSMQCVASNTWGYGGACLTAQSAIFHYEAFDELNIIKAYWRVTWQGNCPEPAQTALRLISADTGPSNINQIKSTFSGGKGPNPLNEAFDITADLQALVASHKITNTFFQLLTQSCGDGTHAAKMYSSSIELVLG